MSNAITLNNQTIAIDDSLRAKSGGIIKISEFASMKGLVVNKETRRLFDQTKKEFYRSNRKALALAAADNSFDVTKIKPVFKKTTGEFMGLDMSCRLAAEAKAGPSEDEILRAAAAKLAAKTGHSIEEAMALLS
jgi:hypothetical protein